MPKQKPNEQAEYRCFPVELRAADGENGRTVTGYAALFDSETDMGWYTEVIDRGAFEGTDLSDVRALFNHDPNQILARSMSGTLTLEVDERGLSYSFEMPDTTLGNDLLTMIRRGDISQSSFAFSIDQQEWHEREGEKEKRVLKRFAKIYDVAPVTYPAYSDTTVAARSRDQYNEDRPAPKHNQDLIEGLAFLYATRGRLSARKIQ